MGMEANSVFDEDTPDTGIFQWAKDKRLWLHFSGFLMFSFLVHGAGFYLFNVVYPTPVRVESNPKSVTVMDATDPSVRRLLQRVSDRTVFLFPPSLNTEARVQLDNHPVRFTPAFQRTQLDFKPLPSPLDASELLDVSRAQPPNPSATAPFRVAVRFEGPLRKRDIAPWSIMRDYLRLAEELPQFRIQVKVALDGTVEVLQVESEIPESDSEGLAKVIESTLRFLPAETEVTGWISIRGRNIRQGETKE